MVTPIRHGSGVSVKAAELDLDRFLSRLLRLEVPAPAA
jgi:hypothetical protein